MVGDLLLRRHRRTGTSPIVMRRLAPLIALFIALSVVGSLGFLRAQTEGDHPFATTWCDAPVVIDLVGVNSDDVPIPGPGVSFSQGAEATIGPRGPALRLDSPGSRVQVVLDQPLFHTQWLVASVSPGDALRTDVIVGNLFQPVPASSVRGALAPAEEQSRLGLRAEAVERPVGTGEIDIFSGVSQILFTNEGGTPIEVLAAIGCPALHLDSEQISAPAWDEERQRFVAQHRIDLNNALTNNRVRALRVTDPRVASPIVGGISLDLELGAGGFSSAELLDVEGSELFGSRINENFDGRSDTNLLAEPVRLVDADPESFTIVVAYEPDFNDPVWSEGASIPAPQLTVSGSVDDVEVGQTTFLEESGPSVSRSTSPEQLDTPTPSITQAVEELVPPSLGSDGRVTMAQELTITNDGEVQLEQLAVDVPFVDMFGPGTFVETLDAKTRGGCVDPATVTFDGGPASVLLFDEVGLAVGESCTLSLQAKIIPGTQPDFNGSVYNTTVTTSARSGTRTVSDSSRLWATLIQDVSLDIDIVDVAVINDENGRHQVRGTISVLNDGALELSDAIVSLSAQRPLTPDEAAAQSAVAAGNQAEPVRLTPVPVFFNAPVGDERCVGAIPPSVAATTAAMSNGVSLAPTNACEIEFSFVAVPGQSLNDWQITASAETFLTAVQPAMSASSDLLVSFSEAPEITSTQAVESVENNGDGTYTVRSSATISNIGDAPIISLSVTNDVVEAFDGQLRFYERIVDSCALVSAQRPLHNANIAPGAETCTVTDLFVIEPGADLDGDTIDWEAVGISTAAAVVETEIQSDTISFSEDARIATSINIESVERVSDTMIAFVLDGSLQNTGDIEARNVQAQLDLAEAFDVGSDDIAFDIISLSVDGLAEAAEFESGSTTDLFTGDGTIARDDRVDFRVLVHATPGAQPGPFTFTVDPEATSPAEDEVLTRDVSRETTIPIITITAGSLTAENNNDGTYSVTHSLAAQNGSIEPLSSIEVFTGFQEVFGEFVVGEVDSATTCTSEVASGSVCEIVETATIRPGSNVGPHVVPVAIAATDSAGVDALVIPQDQDLAEGASSLAPLRFLEEPAIEIDTNVGDATNNSDGTYTVTFDASITNSGDVPLYLVNAFDAVSPAFGSNVVGAQIDIDTCGQVSFGEPLAPGAVCETVQSVTVRPLTNLGPWDATLRVSAQSPALAIIESAEPFEPVSFTEDVSLDITPSLAPGVNNGDGTYTPELRVTVLNTGDVPMVAVAAPDAGAGYGDALLETNAGFDSCSTVSSRQPLLPGAECTIDRTHLILPGSALGPLDLDTEVSGTSPSGAIVVAEATTNAITLTEDPGIELQSEVISVETLEDGTFRVVKNLTITNSGDVRLDGINAQLDLDDVFPDIPYRIDGVISNDLVIEEAFTAGETTELLALGQSMFVGSEAVITLVVSVEPGNDVGPFAGELRSEATSPAGQTTSSVVTSQIDLPSVAVAVLTQSVVNNRDGSYTVTSSYEIVNDGTTTLDFVRLNEDLNSVYEGTRTELVSIDGDGLPVADVGDLQRNSNLIEWAASLDAGASAVMTSTVVVEPGNVLGPFIPTIAAIGVSPTGTVVGAEAVGTNNIEFVEQPALRVDQTLGARPEWTGNRFEVTFTIDVVNDGDVELRGVQVREDLLNALGADSRIVVSDIRSDDFVVNRNFDGLGQFPTADGAPTGRIIGDTRLLSGVDTLAAGSVGTIELDLIITPERRGVYSPRVVVSASTPSGADLGGGDQQIEANTLTRLSVQGELGVAKQVLDAELQGDGSIAVTYEILVENAGPFPLDNVSVHDQLSQAFGVGSEFETSPVRIERGSPCDGFASSSYDGGAADPVLAAGFELNSGERCRIQYDAVVVPSIALPGPYRSSALAIATDPFSGTVIDDSTDGTNTDPDGNHEPGDNDIATSVEIDVPLPSLDIEVAALPSGALDATGRFETGFEINVSNDGLVDVLASRVVVDLDTSWDVDFDVLSLVSQDVDINEDWNGAGETNLLTRRSTVGAGETLTFTLQVRVERPVAGDLDLIVTSQGVSVTGVRINSQSGQPVASNGPDGVSQITLFETLSTEEKRLLGLGSAVFLLFLALGIRSILARVRELGEQREREAARAEAEAKAANDYLILDLRNREVSRPRSVEPVLDLTNDAIEVHARDHHHRPRRRRGRRPQRT